MKTYRDLIDVINHIGNNIGDLTTKGQKKLLKINEKLKVFYEKYSEEREEIRLDGASVDDKGNLILNDKGDYSYTKDAAKQTNAKLKSLLDKEFSYKPIEVVNPNGLEDYFFLEGWVTGVDFIINLEQDEEL
jgi:hypothetical protein